MEVQVGTWHGSSSRLRTTCQANEILEEQGSFLEDEVTKAWESFLVDEVSKAHGSFLTK